MLDHLANISTILGFPAVVIAFLIDARVRTRATDRETHLEMTRRYTDFLRLCMDHADRGLSDTIDSDKVPASRVEAGSVDLVILQILVSLFEDAFYLYHGSSKRLRKLEWTGWEKYVDYWFNRADFRLAWQEHLSFQYNADFMAFMNKKHEAACRAAAMMDQAAKTSN